MPARAAAIRSWSAATAARQSASIAAIGAGAAPPVTVRVAMVSRRSSAIERLAAGDRLPDRACRRTR